MKQENNKFRNIVISQEIISETYINDLNLDFLINSSYKIKQNYLPIQKSNMGGYQSPDILHTLKTFYPLVNNLNNILCQFHNNPNFKIISMWINISSYMNYNDSHTHSHLNEENKFSGVLYLKTPPKSGNIVFIPFKNPNVKQPISPKPGMLLLFPSCLLHQVTPNLSQEDRISIAFNYE